MHGPHILLKKAFDRRKSVGPAISLRDLAKGVQVSPGFLSKVFSGQKGLTPDLALKLCEQLRVDSLQQEQIMQGLQDNLLKSKFGSSLRTRSKTKKALKSLEETTLMTLDDEWILSKWYYLTILDLITCQNFVNDPAWISKRLGLQIKETQDALKKLKQNGFILELENGSLKKAHNRLRFPTSFSKELIREFHAHQMKRSIIHMNSNTKKSDFDRRLITSVTVAACPETIEKVKSILHHAIYEATELLSTGNCSEVYQINLQLFPHTSN